MDDDPAGTGRERFFLTRAEAIRAVCIDLQRYPSQPLLLGQLVRTLWDENAVHSHDGHGKGFWVRRPGDRKSRFIPGEALPARITAYLGRSEISLETLARVCGCVFQTSARTGDSADGTVRGIWVDTGMDRFRCLRCGECCRRLDYHRELTRADYLYWRKVGRGDILQRVRVVRRGGKIAGYRIWVDPETGSLEDVCPWLRHESEKNRYTCRIHDVRPRICRQYPGTRKHARMTGCSAFRKRP